MSAHSHDPRSWQNIAELAAEQGGHVALWQCWLLGLTRDQVRVRLERDAWLRVHRGVYRLPGVPASRRGRMWAALLGVGVVSAPSKVRPLLPSPRAAVADLAAITAWSAADIMGFDGWRPSLVQVLVNDRTVVRRTGVRAIRSRRDISDFWEWRGGLPVARPWRMLWDASHLATRRESPTAPLADLIVYLDRTRLLSVGEALLLLDEPAVFGLPAQPPRGLRHALTGLRGGFSHSATEARARRIASEVAATLGLRLHPRPFPVLDPVSGNVIAEIDLAVPEVRFGGEVDGPHHREPRVRRRDQRRDGKLAVIDWSISRYPVEDIDADECAFGQAFRRDLLAAARRAQDAA